MWSDDTEHSLMVARAILSGGGDPDRFARSLASQFKMWILHFPAGVGLATARSCFKLLVGFGPKRSGVFSAGNGPAMRSAIIGAVFHNNCDLREEHVRVSTEITHTDPRALIGALAVAECVASESAEPEVIVAQLRGLGTEDPEWQSAVALIESQLASGTGTRDFACALGCGTQGVSGYVYHSVPVAIFAWLTHMNWQALVDVQACGGDTDTVGAIAGALVASRPEVPIPVALVDGIWEWGVGVSGLQKIGDQLDLWELGNPPTLIRWFWPLIVVRNFVFLIVVLVHGFARILAR